MRRLVALAAAAVSLVAVATAVAPAHSSGGGDASRGVRIAAAGDIACDPASPSFHGGRGSGLECRQRATSNLLVGGGYAAVLALGDLQYEEGALPAFTESYGRSWGRVKSITRPAPGNHEYETTGASGYYEYFGASAHGSHRGYYSFGLAGWHVLALNANCDEIGGCDARSPEATWLRADLAAHPARCTLAYWHQPRFSSGTHGSDPTYDAFWRALVAAHADVVLAGHDHDYERFAPQDADGRADPARGIREFVVGTGGRELRPFASVQPNSRVRSASTLGVLELTLGAGAYAWRFRPAVGSFADSGSAPCH